MVKYAELVVIYQKCYTAMENGRMSEGQFAVKREHGKKRDKRCKNSR